MRTLTLAEHATTCDVALTAAERDALRRVVGVAITPTAGREGRYDLTPGSQVGVVTVGPLTVTIVPKVPVDRLLFLLSSALDRIAWSDEPISLGTAADLVGAVAAVFVRSADRALARGLLRGYRTREETLPVLRGRLRVAEQVRRHYGRVPPVAVRYDDFTADVEENRLLKAACQQLRRLRLRDLVTARRLAATGMRLDGVTAVRYDPARLPGVHWTRLNVHYRPAVMLARLILRATAVEHRPGAAPAVAFLVDMNRAFEDFVVTMLRDALGVTPAALVQGGSQSGAAGGGRRFPTLDDAGRVALAPDLCWYRGGRPVFVGDVKYKRTRAGGVRHADLYQLLAYTVAADLPGGLLVYAAGEGEPVTHRVRHAGKDLVVAALDLARPPDGVLAQVAALADTVRDLACSGFRGA